jgi:hypothetical protein
VGDGGAAGNIPVVPIPIPIVILFHYSDREKWLPNLETMSYLYGWIVILVRTPLTRNTILRTKPLTGV